MEQVNGASFLIPLASTWWATGEMLFAKGEDPSDIFEDDPLCLVSPSPCPILYWFSLAAL